jgi:hypothetical protein
MWTRGAQDPGKLTEARFWVRADIQDCSKPRTKSGACEKCGAGDHTAIVSNHSLDDLEEID